MDGTRVRAGTPSASGSASPPFVPLVAAAASTPASLPPSAPAGIEIRIAGAVVRAAPGTDAEHLATVLRAVRRSASPS